CTLVLVAAQPALGARHGRVSIQCCRTRRSGVTKCRVRGQRACVRHHGIDLGPGTCDPDPCGGTTTTATSTTTSTTATGAGHVRFLIQPLAAPAACGGPGYGTPASSPFSGEVDDGTGTNLGDLQL